MKFSIITPEHDRNNMTFLKELYDCIVDQTYENWEWVLYLNNNCGRDDLPKTIVDNPKVRVCIAQDDSKDVGHIKNKAFNLGTGDVLVEVDHDDLITADCLEKLAEGYEDPEVGFVYSDNAVLHMTGQFVPYDPINGWDYRMFDWKGQPLTAMRSFPPSAQALGYIWYAPDHVRSWRKQVYDAIGGHNPNLSICDDHELMIRTYLNTKMHHVPEVLYIYRVTGNNTWLERNEAIQIKTVELFDQNIRALAEKDARDRGLLMVDIGGGYNPYPGYTTVDQRSTADFVCDLNDGIPLPDNSVGVLNASHIIEHLHDKTKIMGEIHRVLAHGGYAFIEVPSTDGRGAFQDPTHVSYWNENSFLYYTDKYMADFIENYTIKFQEYRKMTWYPNDWMRNLQVLVTNVVLTAVKDGGERLPGPLRF
jgi:glycosyltransferase involved in cell wall biosynthesis